MARLCDQGKPISLSVGAMGIQLFDGKKFIASLYAFAASHPSRPTAALHRTTVSQHTPTCATIRSLYENMDGWTFDVGDEPISPSRSRAVGVVRIFLERFSDEQVRACSHLAVACPAWEDVQGSRPSCLAGC